MAKRFTDTSKWNKPFLRKMKSAYKLLWLFITDECDHSGIWQVDIEAAELKTGEKLNKEIAISFFKDRIIEIDGGEKWFIPGFVEFQYGELNPNNRAHASVISILRKYNLLDDLNRIQAPYKDLASPLQGAKDKDMDKDKDKDMDKDKLGGAGEVKKPAELKIPVRENVYLKQAEIEKLKIDHGELLYEKCVDKLSAYKLSSGKNYKSDYGAILSWVIDKVKSEKNAGTKTHITTAPAGNTDFSERF